MKINFLGQGFESESKDAVGKYLIEYFKQSDFHSFTCLSAFASKAGISGLSGLISSAKNKSFKNFTLIVGIDQQGTSEEALREILKLNINSYIFYQSEGPIFHPKIYLFEANEQIKLIVGSSNLTESGLFKNVESSLLIEFDKNDKEGKVVLNDIKTYYKLFDFKDDNFFKISNETIEDFVNKGIVPNEATRKEIYDKIKTKIDIRSSLNSLIIPKRDTTKAPADWNHAKSVDYLKEVRDNNNVKTAIDSKVLIDPPVINIQDVNIGDIVKYKTSNKVYIIVDVLGKKAAVSNTQSYIIKSFFEVQKILETTLIEGTELKAKKEASAIYEALVKEGGKFYTPDENGKGVPYNNPTLEGLVQTAKEYIDRQKAEITK